MGMGSDRVRLLQGGPLDDESKGWGTFSELEVPVPCPVSPTRMDRARYDRDGRYVHSVHHEPGRVETCSCSLCPGHQVEPGERVTFQHGEHP